MNGRGTRGSVAWMMAGIVAAVWSMAAGAADRVEQWRPAALDAAVRERIVQRNIFSPSRPVEESPPSAAPAEAREQETVDADAAQREARDPDRELVLVGISMRGGERCAFVEQPGGEVRRMTEPGPIGRGRITAITLSAVTYEVDGERRRIQPGQTLAGQIVAEGGSGGMQRSGATREDASEESSDRAEILRRMRERRAGERGGDTP
ncbi:MAG: hypothetical protein ACODAQ_03070 [Phycisphaeraceae bacterium]